LAGGPRCPGRRIGDGQNKIAVLDPNATEPDPITGTTVMKEVITVLGPTPNQGLPGVHEWCINSAAVDPVNKCAVVNSEDGNAYRWDFTTNTLSAPLNLAPPTGEPYTPTLIGPDGAVYAINNGKLNCCQAVPPALPRPGPAGTIMQQRSTGTVGRQRPTSSSKSYLDGRALAIEK
jgi:hypothetical protein